MGVILPGVERDGIFPQFFRGIGMGRDTFLWEWDGRGLRIHSHVTLYYTLKAGGDAQLHTEGWRRRSATAQLHIEFWRRCSATH